MKKPLHEKLPSQDVRLHYIINHKAISFHWHEEIEILYFEKGKAQAVQRRRTRSARYFRRTCRKTGARDRYL